MRIATFNLENLGTDHKDSGSFEARLPLLKARLESLRADILCLQEIDAVHPQPSAPRQAVALDRLVAGSAYEGFDRALSVRPESGLPADRHNLAILSRWPIRMQEQPWNSLVPPLPHTYLSNPAAGAEPVRWDRPALYGQIALPGGRLLHIINVHLRAPLASPVPDFKRDAETWLSAAGWAEGFFLSAIKRNGQALEVRFLVDRILDREPEALIAVAGDLNAEKVEMPLRILRCDPADTGNPALAQRALQVLGPKARQSAPYTIIHRGRRQWVDHILASEALASAVCEVLIANTQLETGEAPESGLLASHHAPVLAEFALG